MSDEENFKMASAFDIQFKFEKLKISFPFLKKQTDLKVIITLKMMKWSGVKSKQELASIDSHLTPNIPLDINLSHIRFHSTTNSLCFLQVSIKKWVRFLNVFKTVAKLTGEGLQLLQDGIHKTSISLQQNTLGLKPTSNVKLEIQVVPDKKVLLPHVTARFLIKSSPFTDALIPNKVFSLPDGQEPEEGEFCKMSTHGIFSVDGTQHLTVKVLHSLELPMSEIQIFVGGKMSMVAHLVGSDTIDPSLYSKLGKQKGFDPFAESQENSSTNLPFKTMIIKDSHGDLFVCFARWVGFQHAVPRQGTTPGQKFSPGYCQFWFYDLRCDNMSEFIVENFLQN